MHILFITPGFAIDEEDTTCLTYFQNYLHAFSKINGGVSYSILSLHYPFQDLLYDWHGVAVRSLGGSNSSLLKRPRIWLRAWKVARNIIQENGTTVIHSLWLKECCVLGGFLAKKAGIRHVCTAMGTDVLQTNRYLHLSRFFNAHVVCVSSFQRSKLTSTLRSNTSLIPWGLPEQSDPVMTSRPFDFLFVGFLSEIKEVDEFLEIIAMVDRQWSELKINIVGEDYSGGLLERKIDDLELAGTCTVHGLCENARVLALMKESKTLVHTSRFESQGYVFLEALASGMQIVSRRVGLARSTPQWSIAESREEFVVALLQSLESTQVRESIQEHPISQTVNQYLTLYESDQ